MYTMLALILASDLTLHSTLHIGLAALGAALGIGILGAKAAESTGRNPGASGQIMTISVLLAALIEGIVFFSIFLVK